MITAMKEIILREFLRFWHQRERFFAGLVRPLVWLFLFGAGFRAALGLSIIPPYETYILYETYMLPGLAAMIILFNSLQSALSMVYDREMGAMRLLLISPLPRWWLFFSKLMASALVSLVQSLVFFLIAAIYGLCVGESGYILPFWGVIYVMPVLVISGLMLGAMGLFISSQIQKLQNFASIMNFVIFPMFFASTALYPLWRVEDNAPIIAKIVQYNPFSSVVEAIRFGLYQQLDIRSLAIVILSFFVFFALALWGYHKSQSKGRQI